VGKCLDLHEHKLATLLVGSKVPNNSLSTTPVLRVVTMVTRPALWITVMRMPHVIAVLTDSGIANSIFYVVYLLENQDEIGVDSAV